MLGRRVDRNLLVFGCVGHGLWRRTRARLCTTRSFVGRRSYVYLLIHHNTAAVVAGRIYTCMPLLTLSVIDRHVLAICLRALCFRSNAALRESARLEPSLLQLLLCVCPVGRQLIHFRHNVAQLTPSLIDVFVPLRL